MPQIKPVWEEIEEFSSTAEKLIARYPETFAGIEPSWIIAYGCTNKDKPAKSTKPYEISGESEPEAFTNTKKFFVKFFMSDWEGRSEKSKLKMVYSALRRIDAEDPESGRILAPDLKDQGVMVRTFGPDWHLNDDGPHLLEDEVEFIEKPRTEL